MIRTLSAHSPPISPAARRDRADSEIVDRRLGGAGLIIIPMDLRVLASVRYLTSRKYADASEVIVTDRRTETEHK